ncbi:MAG TPA: hypothetical protein VME70_14815 [Mycobacteriales bacterium]|nr:hypothetical protein [Mycobacteriales bacterium]
MSRTEDQRDEPEPTTEPAQQPTTRGERPALGTPGNAQGVIVPHEHALEGSSEDFAKVDGVYVFPESVEEQDDPHPRSGDYKELP